MQQYLNHSAAQIVRQLLINLGLGSASGDWPVLFGKMQTLPDRMIGVLDQEPVQRGRLQPTGVVEEGLGVQILVRAEGYQQARTRMTQIVQALDKQTHLATVTVTDTEAVGTDSDTYLIYNAQRRSGPFPLLDPDSNRNLISVNYVLTISQLT